MVNKQTGFAKKSKTVDAKPEEQTRLQNDNQEWDVVAWINTLNTYDKASGKYTEDINPNTFVVKTNEPQGDKPEIIGYISVKTLNEFMEGNKRSVPIKKKKDN